MRGKLMVFAFVFGTLLRVADAHYAAWRHSGSMYLLTTPEGANLPAAAAVADFPVLVRLDKNWFDFNQTKARGEDIRFADGTGAPLAYQIEEWDAAAGTAVIWVRIPSITGHARQELKLYWGNADADCESSGSGVFSAANGYASVLHLGETLRDEVGSITGPPGVGGARRFARIAGERRSMEIIRSGRGVWSWRATCWPGMTCLSAS